MASLGSAFQGALGGIGASALQQQQNLYAQQAQANALQQRALGSPIYAGQTFTANTTYATATVSTDWSDSNSNWAIGDDGVARDFARCLSRPATNLEWLDKRVNEMRVQL